jgi:TPP-dependent pyruvate/acetoin dehydrogenase alpha subunit
VDPAAIALIESEVKAEMQVAVDFAVAAPYPNPDEAEQDVYA